MIRKLHLTNFKVWRELEAIFAPVTGIFGGNSAGKSSIIQFLLLLKQTKDATDRRIVLDFGGPESLANLGSYREVVHRRDPGADIGWELAWSPPKDLRFSLQSRQSRQGKLTGFRGRDLDIQCEVGLSDPERSSALLARRLEFGIGSSQARSTFELLPSNGQKSYELRVTKNDRDCTPKRSQGRPFNIPPPVKTHAFPQEVRWSYQDADFLSDLELSYESLMDRIFYLGPLRDYPQRQYYWSGASPADVGPRGERTIDAILAARAQEERRQLKPRAHRQPFEQIIAHWLRELGLIDHFAMEEIGTGSNLYKARVSTNASAVPTTLTDVGIGVSQVLPVLVLLYYVPEHSVVLLEQPEIHLHPAVQSRLADLLLCVAKHRKLQIIVESHSQHLLQRLQRRVAEGEVGVPGKGPANPFEISSDDVRLYFSSVRHGVGRLEDLQLNRWGEIENWPEGFFGDEMEEIAAISSASLRRKLADAAP